MFTCANCGSVFSSKQRLQSHENSATACEKARKRAKIASQTFASPTKCSSKQIVAQIASPHNSSLQRSAIPYVQATVAVNRRPASPATCHLPTGAVNGPSNQQNPVVVVATDFATRTPTAAGSSQSGRPGIHGSSAAAVASRFSAKGVLAATFCCKKKWQLLVVWAAPQNAPSKQVPVFVALMNSKYEISYLSVFDAMRRCIPDWQPKAFTCDFELALRTQFAAVFGAEFQGCIWHFLKVSVF